jgi:hypothetical protein
MGMYDEIHRDAPLPDATKPPWQASRPSLFQTLECDATELLALGD